MKVAFYAPMKAPTHPVASGDRTVARLLMKALRHAGCEVRLASRFRSYDRDGCAARQQTLERRGAALAARLLERYRRVPEERPDLWFTYHLYHKSPDWLGPAVTAATGIPYVVAEASHSPRQAHGDWRLGHASALGAMRGAAAIVCLNPKDRPGLESIGIDAARLHELAPFVDRRQLLRQADAANGRAACRRPVLVTVAMMREGDKLSSYRVLASALGRILERSWQLLVVGAGPAEAAVRAAFRSVPAERVTFAGARAPSAVPALVRGATAMVWPAHNEAWGMVFLEAAALGVPAVAGRNVGVASVIADRRSGLLVDGHDDAAMAAAIAALLDDPARRDALAVAAAERVVARHDLPVAAETLRAALARVMVPA